MWLEPLKSDRMCMLFSLGHRFAVIDERLDKRERDIPSRILLQYMSFGVVQALESELGYISVTINCEISYFIFERPITI